MSRMLISSRRRNSDTKTLLRTACLVFTLLRISCADDAVFEKSILIKSDNATPTPVDLIVSDAGLAIRGKGNRPVITDFPYAKIKKLGYTFLNQRRDALMPLLGVTAHFLKGQSHWLVIEPAAGGSDSEIVLRLDKTEFSGVITALEAKSGKPVEMLAPGTLVDPTKTSADEDETVPFLSNQVLAAVKGAMTMYSCKLGKSKPNRVDCSRMFRPPDGIGGGETVTALLEPEGSQTRVQIRTQTGFGRNWSAPIYREMLRRLRSAN